MMLQGLNPNKKTKTATRRRVIVAALEKFLDATVGLQTQAPVFLDGNCKAAMLKAGEKTRSVKIKSIGKIILRFRFLFE